MTYEDAYRMLGQIKAFTRQRKEVQDKRRKTAELVHEQLDDAYRVCCTVEGHLRTAERQDKGKNGTSSVD